MKVSKTWTDEQLIELAPKACSMSNLLTMLGVSSGGGSWTSVQKRLIRLGLPLPPNNQRWNMQDDAEWVKKNLIANHPVQGRIIRKRLVSIGLWRDCCHNCGITEWAGEPAPLQVEHLDGDHSNNRFANLALLCANCHAITPTWGNKKRETAAA